MTGLACGWDYWWFFIEFVGKSIIISASGGRFWDFLKEWNSVKYQAPPFEIIKNSYWFRFQDIKAQKSVPLKSINSKGIIPKNSQLIKTERRRK